MFGIFKVKGKNKNGFTLIELMVAMFVFALVMVTVSMVFVNFFNAYKKIRVAQSNAESVQYALNLMAKTLRTSSIISPSSANSTSPVIVTYDYSQGVCVKYEIVSNELRAKKVSALENQKNNCVNLVGVTSSADKFVGGYIGGGSFYSTPSSPSTAGMVTVSLDVCSASGCSGNLNNRVRLQTTVSLRDYKIMGL